MERSTIHLLHKRGRSQREIAEELGRSRTTVARALAEPVDRQPAKRQRASIVDPYREQIAQWVREGLTAVRMLELVRADPAQPYMGKHAIFRAAVRLERLRQHQVQAIQDVPVRFEGLPGEYLQVDWGEIRHFPFTRLIPQAPVTQGVGHAGGQASGTRYFLACRLKYSRWVWVRFTTDMRQETLFRGLVDCFCAMGFVPWVLVFDNMRTVTSGRDAQGQAVWNPALLQLATEFGFHPEACTPGAANQKGSVESLVKWVQGNFLAGRDFADDTDLDGQCTVWVTAANERPSRATDMPPVARLVDEAAKGGVLPPAALDYGFLHSGRVSAEALVAVLGNQYSVPIVHIGAPVTLRLHRERVALWRDTLLLAEHVRAPDGAHRRVVEPSHYALVFAKKPRAQVMLFRETLLQLSDDARWYVSELSHRRRAHLRQEILAVYTLYQQHGASRLLAAMVCATERSAYGADYLAALLALPEAPHSLLVSTLPDTVAPAPTRPAGNVTAAALAPAGDGPLTERDLATLAGLVALTGVPGQDEVDRHLSLYERFALVELPGTSGAPGTTPPGWVADVAVSTPHPLATTLVLAPIATEVAS